jgi:enoyl-CoA hydratase
MSDPVVLVEKKNDERIWVVTMNRPEKRNALGGGMIPELTRVWQEFRDTKQARVAVLTGAGTVFSAGADLKEMRENREAKAAGIEIPRLPDTSFTAPVGSPAAEALDLWKPVIAAVNGHAIAGGFLVAMNCDIRIAVDGARFGVSEAKWGQGGGGLMAPLTRIMGLGHALEFCLWGDGQMEAQRAFEMGFVNQIVSPDKLMETAMEWATRMVYLAPKSVRNVKQMLYKGYYMDPPEALNYAKNLEQNLIGMKDGLEGLRAFAEKRSPNFLDE